MHPAYDYTSKQATLQKVITVAHAIRNMWVPTTLLSFAVQQRSCVAVWVGRTSCITGTCGLWCSVSRMATQWQLFRCLGSSRGKATRERMPHHATKNPECFDCWRLNRRPLTGEVWASTRSKTVVFSSRSLNLVPGLIRRNTSFNWLLTAWSTIHYHARY